MNPTLVAVRGKSSTGASPTVSTVKCNRASAAAAQSEGSLSNSTFQAQAKQPAHLKMQTRLLVWLGAITTMAVATTVDAATCSQTQAQSIYGLYQSAAKLSGCAPYAKYSDSGSVSIAYTCSATNCVPIMMQLARQLPSCESATTGVNNKQQLEYGLYSQCKFCTDAQDDQITALWKAAAQTSSCSKYASSSSYSTSFSWPCSATGCTAVLKDLASKVPDCFTGTVNEKNRILRAVSSCTSTTPSTNKPSPVSTSTASTTTPATQAPTSNPSTSSPSTTSSPSNSSESGEICSETEQSDSASIWETAAADSACSKYATVSSTQVLIVWPCTATSCTTVMENVGAKLPSCILPGLMTSEKSKVQETVKNCKASGSSEDTRAPDGSSSSSSTTTPSYSSSTCTTPQVKAMASDYLATAQSAECKQYSNVTAFKISIYAPCTSTCVTKGFQSLADDVPNCYYAYEGENKKKELNTALAACSEPGSNGRERFLQAGKYVQLDFTATTTIDASASVSPAPATSGCGQLHATSLWLWLMAACAMALVSL